MAENKMGPNIQAGAGFLAKRVQKSLNRAQEKVLQKLGKTMETKDEQFEQCSLNLSKQQADGVRLTKDVRAYFTAVKAIHESSKRLSQTLKYVYESEWKGGEDLSDIVEKEDLMWNDYEEKMSDQIVRTMDNYTGQFPEVKERVAKRGRKLVDYDSARHHLEALQAAKKKDDGKIAKAEDEFNKAQNVFEELNNELREELPALYQSRIGCYVTVFQNISNLRDVFYKEMSLLNHELYNVMKKLETQHSGKPFIIKGLSSSKSKKRKSIVISNPIPCNTAFPTDHVSVHPTGQGPAPLTPGDASSSSSSVSDLDDLASNGVDTPKSQLACNSEGGDCGAERRSLDHKEAEADPPELSSSQSDDSGVGVPTAEVAGQEEAHPLPPVRDAPLQQSALEQKDEAGLTPLPKTKPPPVPTPRVSFGAADRRSDSRGKAAARPGVEAEKEEVEAEKEEVEAEKEEVEKEEVEAEKEEVEKEEVEAEKEEVEAEKEEVEAEKEEVEAEKEEVEAEKEEVEAEKEEVETEKEEVEAEKEEVEAEKEEVEAEKDTSGKDSAHSLAGSLYKGGAVASHASSEEGVLGQQQEDIARVLADVPDVLSGRHT